MAPSPDDGPGLAGAPSASSSSTEPVGLSEQPTRQGPRLTAKTLFVLGSMNMIDCINANLLTPYVDEMVSNYMGLSPENPRVGHVVGLLIGLYSVCEVLFSVLWGAISDRFGRKPALLIGLGGSVIAPIMFGLGQSLPVVFAARFLDGFFCGNVGISRTYLGELADESNETKAFGFLAIFFSVGLFVGPLLGGQLVHPVRFAPHVFGGTIFETYPYLLPNLTYAIFAAVAWVIGAVFLEETLPPEARKKTLCCGRRESAREPLRRQLSRSWTGTDPGGTPRTFPMEPEERRGRDSCLGNSFCSNRTLVQVIGAYCVLGASAASSVQLFVLLVSYPADKGGFGFSPSQIGLVQNAAAVGGLTTQLFVYPPLCKRFGFFRTMVFGWCVYVTANALFPLYAVFADTDTYGDVPRYIGLGCMQFFQSCGLGICFPTAFVFINRAAQGMDKGTANGMANSCGALCRGLFPPMSAWLLGVFAASGLPDGPYLALHGLLACGTFVLLLVSPGLRAADQLSVRKARAPEAAAAAAADAEQGARCGGEDAGRASGLQASDGRGGAAPRPGAQPLLEG